ncbi:hypothetical protein AAG570_003508 [Ranatra chinensis]|uniref:Ribosome biogenesis protein NOP53 n=1 Tax=Ranatra chinensis TaxID=642074 RepID=A0ABD0Y479_9HEMI
MIQPKKKGVSKKSKKSWRKHVNIQDVDDFLDDKRLEERLGGPFENKKDEELFFVDTKPLSENELLSRKERSLRPLKCLEILKSTSSVQDPVIKRNRVRTREERRHPIRKRIYELNRARGILPKREVEASRQSLADIKKKKRLKKQSKTIKFVVDSWRDGNDDFEGQAWLLDDTVRHNLTNTRNLKVSVPRGVQKKKSVLPAIENPHPGISYNPSYGDHRDLLAKVAEDELKLQKEEEHIARVTTEIFSKVTPQEKEESWVKEMSQGLFPVENRKEETPEEIENEYKAINPPVDYKKKKTLKQKRKQREQKQAAVLRKQLKMEKRKIADIYKLRMLNNEVEVNEKKQANAREKKKALAEKKATEPKRLGPLKFTAPNIEFNPSTELKGNLRGIKPSGNLLTDRFYSLQKRNILPPNVKLNRYGLSLFVFKITYCYKLGSPLLQTRIETILVA